MREETGRVEEDREYIVTLTTVHTWCCLLHTNLIIITLCGITQFTNSYIKMHTTC